MKIIPTHILLFVDTFYPIIQSLLNLPDELLPFLYKLTLYPTIITSDNESKSLLIFLVFISDTDPKVNQKDIIALSYHYFE